MKTGNERFTLDTNVLVYALDGAAGAKQKAAGKIIDAARRFDCWLTLQSVSEFYFSVTRKRIVPASRAADQARDWLDLFRCVPPSSGAVRTALVHAVAGAASYWDALLVATAAEAGCTLILSEDLADGSKFGGVSVHNPFAASGGVTDRARYLLGLT